MEFAIPNDAPFFAIPRGAPQLFPSGAMNANLCSPHIAECRLKPDLRFVATTLSKMKEFFYARGLTPNAWSELEPTLPNDPLAETGR
jgi:hypothetical protein